MCAASCWPQGEVPRWLGKGVEGPRGLRLWVSVLGWLMTEGRRRCSCVSVCEYVAGCGPPQPDRFCRVCEDREVWGAAQDTERGRERVCGEGCVYVCVEKRQ